MIGVVASVWRHWLAMLACVGFGAATLAAFYLSVTVGLFGLHETAAGTPQILAEASEWTAVVAGGLAFAFGPRPARLTFRREDVAVSNRSGVLS
ncbi:MAG: hypothetical protein DLM56_01790 [Pseudonocardiales bacterium]|nr:MAG: hypothetical protein DLM56_01790 [Pseudonocardiales bacterium]